MGVIIRTVGENQKQRYFVRDLHLLLTAGARSRKHQEKPAPSASIRSRTSLSAPCAIPHETSQDRRGQREQAERIREMIADQPPLAQQGQTLRRPEPIFEKTGVEKQIEQAFRRKSGRSAALLVIDETEALISIDVNTAATSPAATGADHPQTNSKRPTKPAGSCVCATSAASLSWTSLT